MEKLQQRNRTHMTVKLMKEIDQYKVCLSVVSFENNLSRE